MIREGNPINIPLHVPKFSVDTHYHVPEPLPKASMFACFLGPPRSGKTSAAVALLTQTNPKLYRGVFHHVYMFIPADSLASMKDNPFTNHSKDKIFHEFTEETLHSVVERLEATTKKEQHSLIVIDDFMSNLKDTSLRKSLERIVANRRHLRCSVWMISQNCNAIPLSTRRLISDVFLFRSANQKEVRLIHEELVPLDKHIFQAIYNYVFPPGGDPHNFMYINIASGEIFNRFTKMMVR